VIIQAAMLFLPRVRVYTKGIYAKLDNRVSVLGGRTATLYTTPHI